MRLASHNATPHRDDLRHKPQRPMDLRELRLEPVRALAQVDNEGYGQTRGVFHLVLHERHQLIALRTWYLEDQFVVDLQEHAAAHLARAECGVDTNHRNLDE